MWNEHLLFRWGIHKIQSDRNTIFLEDIAIVTLWNCAKDFKWGDKTTKHCDKSLTGQSGITYLMCLSHTQNIQIHYKLYSDVV